MTVSAIILEGWKAFHRLFLTRTVQVLLTCDARPGTDNNEPLHKRKSFGRINVSQTMKEDVGDAQQEDVRVWDGAQHPIHAK